MLQSHSNKNSMVLHKRSHIDHWNKIEEPHLSPWNYSHLILTKMPKTHTEGDDILKKKNASGKTICLHIKDWTTINSKWIEDSKVKLETLKWLEEMVWGMLQDRVGLLMWSFGSLKAICDHGNQTFLYSQVNGDPSEEAIPRKGVSLYQL